MFDFFVQDFGLFHGVLPVSGHTWHPAPVAPVKHHDSGVFSVMVLPGDALPPNPPK